MNGIWTTEANDTEADLIIANARIAQLEAELAQRDKGCAWCKAEYTIIDDDFGQPLIPKIIKHCFHCGKKLEEKE